MSNYPRGSEWRRWDLHIHSPCSAHETNFPSWGDYIDAIERARPEICCVGITDYWSIEGYKKLVTEKIAGRLANISLLIPNIEMRLTTASARTAMNIHVLFSPEDIHHISRIEEALSRLTFSYDGEQFSCSRVGMTNLGHKFLRKTSNPDVAYKEGNKQFKIDFDALVKWLNGDSWVKNNALLAVPNNSGDGASGLQRDDAYAAFRENIYRHVDFIFSPKPGDRKFFSTLSPKAKACVHGSDAHDLNSLFEPDQGRYCWIKADPTFEGLRQVLYEPLDRVWIGTTPPSQIDQAQILESVSVHGSDSWFENAHYPLNSGLVAIIGQKGSGKSALAELIAAASGSWYPDDGNSFLERSNSKMPKLAVTLRWRNGEETHFNSAASHQQSAPQRLRYLSQRRVERLCSDDISGRELEAEIEKVVFDTLDTTETLNASNFAELKTRKTQRFESLRDSVGESIRSLITEYDLLRREHSTLSDKRSRITAIAKERLDLEKQEPTPTSDEHIEIRSLIESLSAQIQDVSAKIGVQKSSVQRLDDAESAISTFEARMQAFYVEVTKMLAPVILSPQELEQFRPVFQGSPKAIIEEIKERLKQDISTLEGDIAAPTEGTKHALEKLLSAQMQRQTSDEVLRERLASTRRRLAELATEERRLAVEIAKIEGEDVRRREAIKAELVKLYRSAMDAFMAEKKILQELYLPLTQLLKDGSVHEKKLGFTVEWRANFPVWLERGGRLFNRQRRLPFGSTEEFSESLILALNTLLSHSNEDPTDDSQFSCVQAKMLEKFEVFASKEHDISAYLRASVSWREACEWLFDRGGSGNLHSGISGLSA